MNIEIRRATEADIELIQEFGVKLLNHEREKYDANLDADWAHTEAAKAKYLTAILEKYVAIAEADGKPVGFLIGNIIAPGAGNARNITQANVQNIYTDEAQRGNGVGSKLLNEFKAYCVSEGVKRLNVSVLADNTDATRFYEGAGFRPRSINYYQEL